MGKKRATEYDYPLSDQDSMVVSFSTLSRKGSPALLVSFCVDYLTLIDGHWHEVLRYDNAHGIPHVHMNGISGESRNVTLGDDRDAPRIFNEAQDAIKTSFKKLRNEYLER